MVSSIFMNEIDDAADRADDNKNDGGKYCCPRCCCEFNNNYDGCPDCGSQLNYLE